MNFLALSYFRMVAEELNITHAAQKLYITQQALSFQIKKLEDELGVELFTRSPRLALTDAGRCLYNASLKIEDVSSELNDKLNDIRMESRGDLRIGLSFSRGQFILPSILPEYTVNNPKVHIRLFEEPSSALIEKLLRNEIDFWITAEQPLLEGIGCDELFTERFFLIIPRKVVTAIYGKKRAEEILSSDVPDMARLIECPIILLSSGNRSRDLFDNAMRIRHLVPNIVMETDNLQTAFALSQKEMALTIYSEMFLRNYAGALNPQVMIVPIDSYIPNDVVKIFYTEESMRSKYKVNFLKSIHRAIN